MVTLTGCRAWIALLAIAGCAATGAGDRQRDRRVDANAPPAGLRSAVPRPAGGGAGGGGGSGSNAVVAFDDMPSGSVIDTRYVGLTFRKAKDGTSVYAVQRIDGTGNAVSFRATGPWPSTFAAEEGAVDVVFAVPQSQVSIDAHAVLATEYLGTPNKKPFLQAFATTDDDTHQLAITYYDLARFGEWQTLSITRPGADIARVRFSSQNNWAGLTCPSLGCPDRMHGGIYGEFDNLRFDRGQLDLQYVGCFEDTPERTLPVALMDGGATRETCVASAYAEGFRYAGLQFQGQCFGGNVLPPHPANRSECETTTCSAAPSEYCGGVWRNSVFATGVTPPSYTYLGCYSDDAQRGLPIALMASGTTVESCVELARARGYAYAGLQAGYQCFAGNSLAYERKDEGNCKTQCAARRGETCGGTWFNSVYATGLNPPPLDYAGCHVDDPSRALPNLLIGNGATIERCIDLARAQGYAYAGLQAGYQCFAGNVLGYCAAREDDCNAPCPSDPKRKCGGAWRASIYRTGVTPVPRRPALVVINPHGNDPYYLVGSAHNHTIGLGCATEDDPSTWLDNCGFKREMAQQFKARGYDFAAFTDHEKSNTGRMEFFPFPRFTDWSEAECPTGMVCLWGAEAGQGGPHHLFFGWTKESIDSILQPGRKGVPQAYRTPNDASSRVHADNIRVNVSILAHPGGNGPECAQKVVDSLFPSPSAGRSLTFDGVEINGPDNYDFWTWALGTRIDLEGRAAARPLWGFTSDDQQPDGVSKVVQGGGPSSGWLMVNSRTRIPSRDDILLQLKRGNFFAVQRLTNLTGMTALQRPQVSITTTPDAGIRVATNLPSTIRFYDVCGVLRRETLAYSDVYLPDGNEGFVRVSVDQTLNGNLLRIHSQPITVRRQPDR